MAIFTNILLVLVLISIICITVDVYNFNKRLSLLKYEVEHLTKRLDNIRDDVQFNSDFLEKDLDKILKCNYGDRIEALEEYLNIQYVDIKTTKYVRKDQDE